MSEQGEQAAGTGEPIAEPPLAGRIVPTPVGLNAEFYAWKDKAITLHESIQFHERVHLP
mgnify:CR=1 FL=1